MTIPARILNKAEAASYLRKSERVIQDLVRDGYLAAKRNGKHLQFDIAELDRYWDSLPDA